MSDTQVAQNSCVFRITVFGPSCLRQQSDCRIVVNDLCPSESLLEKLPDVANFENYEVMPAFPKQALRKVSPMHSEDKHSLQASPVRLPYYHLSTDVSLSRTPDQLSCEEIMSERQAEIFWKQFSQCANNPNATCASKLQTLLQNELTAEIYWVLIGLFCRSEGHVGSEEVSEKERSVENKRSHKLKKSIDAYIKPILGEELLKELSRRGKQQTLARVVQKMLTSSNSDQHRELTAKSKCLLESWKVKIEKLRELAETLKGQTSATPLQLTEAQAGATSLSSCQQLQSAISCQQTLNRQRIEQILGIADQRMQESFSHNFSHLTACFERIGPCFTKTDKQKLPGMQVSETQLATVSKPYFRPFEFNIERAYFEQQKRSKQEQLTRSNSSQAQTQVYRPSKDTCQVCENEISYEENLLVYCSVT